MSYYAFLPPFGRDKNDGSSSSSPRDAGQFKIGDEMHIPWNVQSKPDVVELVIAHQNDPDSDGYNISTTLPYVTNFTWTIDAKLLYSASSTSHRFIFRLHVPGRDAFYTSLPFNISGDLPTTPPATLAPEPTSTSSVPPGSLETITPPKPSGPTTAEKGLIATAIVLGAAIIIGGIMAFIYRKSLARKFGKRKTSPANEARGEALEGANTRSETTQVDHGG